MFIAFSSVKITTGMQIGTRCGIGEGGNSDNVDDVGVGTTCGMGWRWGCSFIPVLYLY